MPGKYENILETIGRTPVVRLNKLAPEGINLFVKIESFNPMGSVKDRLALNVIEQAERDGTLKPGQPVVLFAHEWCEFCWFIRKMFAKYEIPYGAVDLDSVAYQEDNKGGKIRAALREKPAPGLSRRFLSADNTLAALRSCSTHRKHKKVDVDPYSFLPAWLQQR